MPSVTYAPETILALTDERSEVERDRDYYRDRLTRANVVIDVVREFVRVFNGSTDWDREYEELLATLRTYDSRKVR